MVPGPHRQKGGAPQLGATLPGLEGPFGRYADGEPDDGTQASVTDVPVDEPRTVLSLDGRALDTRDADDRVAAQVADAAARRERRARERQERQQRRRAGLAQRHAAKLRALAERDRQTQPEPPDAA